MLAIKRASLLALTVLAIAVLVPAPAQAASPKQQTFTYVSADVYVVGPDLVAAEIGEATGRHVAPLGSADFVPATDRLTVVVDDVAKLSGPLPVSITSRSGSSYHCISDSQASTFRVVPGEWVSITIWGAAFSAWSPCRSGGTTGTLTVRG